MRFLSIFFPGFSADTVQMTQIQYRSVQTSAEASVGIDPSALKKKQI
jgi:hypothetical protein